MLPKKLRGLSPSAVILIVGLVAAALLLALQFAFSARQALAREGAPGPPEQGTPTCGDGKCDKKSGEDCKSCPKDCGKCQQDFCGDGKCEADRKEDCDSCPKDCGRCPPEGECGNEKVEAGEACDGIGQDAPNCKDNFVCQGCQCVPGYCGDWVHQPGLGEECDGGWGCAQGFVCTEKCTCAPEGGGCVPQTCKDNEYFDTGQCACMPRQPCQPLQCPDGQVFDTAKCVCVPTTEVCEPKECKEGEYFDRKLCECIPADDCEPDSGENESARQAADAQDPNGAQPTSLAYFQTPDSPLGTTNFNPASLDVGQSESKDCDGDDGERCDCWEIGANVLNTWGGRVTRVPLLCCDENGQCTEGFDGGEQGADGGPDYYDGNTPLLASVPTVGYLASLAPQTTQCQPQECADDEYFDTYQCACLPVPGQCQPVQCNDNEYFDTGQCACLPSGGGCEPRSCKPDEYFDRKQCECVPSDGCQPQECKEDEYFDTGQCACLPTGDTCIPVTCPPGQYFDKRQCACLPGDGCIPYTCKPGEYFDKRKCKCVPEGYRLCICGPGRDFCRPRTGDDCIPTLTLDLPNGDLILRQVYPEDGQTATPGMASTSSGLLASVAPQIAGCEPQECEEGEIFDTGQCACVPTGQECEPRECKEGEVFDTGQCACVPTGQECEPRECKEGETFDRKLCECVPTDQGCEPQTCPQGKHFDTGQCTCVPDSCPTGPTECTSDKYCVEKYGPLSYCNPNTCLCFPCPADSDNCRTDSECQKLTGDTNAYCHPAFCECSPTCPENTPCYGLPPDYTCRTVTGAAGTCRDCECVPEVRRPPLEGYLCDEPSRLCIDLVEPQTFLTTLRQNDVVQDYDALVLWDCEGVPAPGMTTALVTPPECEQKPLEVEGNGSRACADCEGDFCAFGPGRRGCILVPYEKMPDEMRFSWQHEYDNVEGQASQVDEQEVWALICPEPPIGHICIPIGETMLAAYQANHTALADCFSGDPDDANLCPVLTQQELQLEQDENGQFYLCFDAGPEYGYTPNCGPEPDTPYHGCAPISLEGGSPAAGGPSGLTGPGGLLGAFGLGGEGGLPLWLLLLFVLLALLGLFLLFLVIVMALRRAGRR